MKNLLVIGGNSDIGFETAKNFAYSNFTITLASRDYNSLIIKKEILEKKNFVCDILEFDILGDYENLNLFSDLKQKPEVLLICSGYLENPEKNYEKIIKINYFSIILFLEKYLQNETLKNSLKTIICISSAGADRGKRKNNIYSSAKSGLSNYLQGLRQRLNKININVITVKPGYVDTKMTKNLNLPSFFTLKKEVIGKRIFMAYKNKQDVTYASFLWRIISMIYNLIPESIFKKLK